MTSTVEAHRIGTPGSRTVLPRLAPTRARARAHLQLIHTTPVSPSVYPTAPAQRQLPLTRLLPITQADCHFVSSSLLRDWLPAGAILLLQLCSSYAGRRYLIPCRCCCCGCTSRLIFRHNISYRAMTRRTCQTGNFDVDISKTTQLMQSHATNDIGFHEFLPWICTCDGTWAGQCI